MRRGKISKYSFILIVLVGISTVFSFLFDQLAIRTEDKQRNSKITFQNFKDKTNKYITIEDYFYNLRIGNKLVLQNLLLERNFYIKNLLILDLENNNNVYKNKDLINSKNYFIIKKDLFSDESGEFLLNKRKDPSRVIKYLILSELYSIRNLIDENYIKFTDFMNYNKDYFNDFKNNDLINKKLFEFNKDGSLKNDLRTKNQNTDFFKKNNQVLSSAKNIDDTVNNFEFEDWLGLYNYKMYLLKNVDFHLKKLYQLELLIGDEIEVREENQEMLFDALKKFSSRKNLFILTSISFQILSLFFLLLLFKNLINNKDR